MSRDVLLLCAAILLALPTQNAVADAPETTGPGATKTVKEPNTTFKAETDDKDPDTPTSGKKSIAEVNFWQSLELLKSQKNEDLVKGRTVLKSAADQEFTHAQTLLAECLMTGQYGFPKDQRKAVNYYRLAAERGNAFAMVSLGQCFYSGTGVRKNQEKAVEWLTAAIDEKADYSRPTPPAEYLSTIAKTTNDQAGTVAGELDRDTIGDCKAAAHYLLGLMASQAKKPDAAQKHYVAAATAGIDGSSGIYLAAVQAALNYAFGQGTARDMVKANEMLAASRKLTVRSGMRRIHNYTTLKIVDDFATGDLEEELESAGATFQTTVQFEIANAFTDKKSKDYNPAEAVKWFELAAENNNAWAMLNLAFLYSGNELGQPDPAKAFTWFEKVGSGKNPKHTLGTANYGICLYNGLGTPKDTTKAMEHFKKYKDSVFVCYLGTKGECPKTVLNWDQWIKLIETWAKDKKDPQAQYFLGKRYLDGWDVEADPKVAIRWFKKASAAGHGQSWTELGVLHEFNNTLFNESSDEGIAAAAECYKHASDASNPNGMANYANMLNNGIGLHYDPNTAEQLYIRCLEIDPDHARAHNNLGGIYEDLLRKYLRKKQNNSETAAIREKMFIQYEAAVQLKFPWAARNLGRIYREGHLVPIDFRKAYGYYEQAIEWGMPDEHFTLGEMHELGQGIPITYAEAAYHYRLAALEGNKEALRRLVEFYVTGKGVSRDLDRAIYWTSLLAEKGDIKTIIRLGDLLIQNHDYKKARSIFSELPESGYPGILGIKYQRLSILYANGWGITKDQKLAQKYREKALREGNLRALHDTAMSLIADGKKSEAVSLLEQAVTRGMNASKYQLGTMYLNGDCVPKNAARGLALLNAAADDDYADAQIALATLTFSNTPGAPDLETAIRLGNAAAASGHPKANELVEKLEKRRDKKNDDAPEEAARARSS